MGGDQISRVSPMIELLPENFVTGTPSIICKWPWQLLAWPGTIEGAAIRCVFQDSLTTSDYCAPIDPAVNSWVAAVACRLAAGRQMACAFY